MFMLFSGWTSRKCVFIVVLSVLTLIAPFAALADTCLGYDEFADYALLSATGSIDLVNGSIYGDVGTAPGAEFYAYNASFVTGDVHVSDPSLLHVLDSAWIGGTQVCDTSVAIDDAYYTSAYFAGLPGTSIPDITGNKTISGTSGDYNVFELERVDLSDHHVVTLEGDGSTWFVFNVTDEFLMSGTPEIELSGGVTADHVLWNVTGTNDTKLSGDSLVYGTVLAPSSYVKLNGGEVFGSVIGDWIKVDSDGEVHYNEWEPIPEPGTWALMLSSLGLLGWLKRRRATS